MKIDNSTIAVSFADPANSKNTETASGFQAALDAALSTKASELPKPMTAAEKAQKAKAADAAASEEFLTYMKKTPMQRMREAILKEMGLTEDDLKAMDPEQRAAAEAAIAERIKARMLMQAKEQADKASQQAIITP